MPNQTKREHQTVLLPAAMLAVLFALFFLWIYNLDNKYQTPPPYGKNGIIHLTKEDLQRDMPLFLIDGWLLSDCQVTEQPTYIGEFSTLQRGKLTASPHGAAAYQLTLDYKGAPMEVMLSFPQIFTNYTIFLDGEVIAKGKGSARFSFPLTEGRHPLLVKTVSRQGYYSGLYHPPALAAADKLLSKILIQCSAYGFAFFASLTLALFTLVLWNTAKDKTAFWFGLLCLFFSGYLSYYFVRLYHLPFAEYWYLVQSMAFYGLSFCVLRLAALSGGIRDAKDSAVSENSQGFRTVVLSERIFLFLAFLLLLLAMLIPVFSWAVWLHGVLTDLMYIYIFSALLWILLQSKSPNGLEGVLTQSGCMVFGAGLVCNLLFSNAFEPILFFWQFEWCGLFLVFLFGAMMAARNKRLLQENNNLQNHLEVLVAQRTKELSHLLEERKAFFADMAHDLKAPIYATQSFIRAIRENNTGVDRELMHYIDEVEIKQQEMASRVTGLSAFNRLDAVAQPREPVSVSDLLQEIYDIHSPSAEVEAVTLTLELPDTDGFLYAQRQKLLILFENLFFNALHATPPDGMITLGAELDSDGCHFYLSDTGCGIPFDEIPHLFDRFYVGRNNKGRGSGLGLAIVKSIVDELEGEITLSSTLGKGTTFHIDIPVMEERRC